MFVLGYGVVMALPRSERIGNSVMRVWYPLRPVCVQAVLLTVFARRLGKVCYVDSALMGLLALKSASRRCVNVGNLDTLPLASPIDTPSPAIYNLPLSFKAGTGQFGSSLWQRRTWRRVSRWIHWSAKRTARRSSHRPDLATAKTTKG